MTVVGERPVGDAGVVLPDRHHPAPADPAPVEDPQGLVDETAPTQEPHPGVHREDVEVVVRRGLR